MGDHICTDESLIMRDENGEKQIVNLLCPFCIKKRKFYVTFVDTICSKCGLRIYEGHGHELLKKIRNHYKMTRKEFGKELGYSLSTIKGYEQGYFTEKYFDKVIEYHGENYRKEKEVL